MQFIPTTSQKDFVRQGVQSLKESITHAFEKHGSCCLGLSGGSTPRPIYEELGKEDIDWSKVTVFLTDERYVLPDDEDSNQKMVTDTLLKHASVPHSNLIFPDTSLPIDDCIGDYSEQLKKMIDDSEWLPDVITLGLGTDGHIASLFPPVPEIAMTDLCFALHTTTDNFEVPDRISLALNVIGSASDHIFFLKGEDKKKVWEEMMESGEGESRWPAKRILEPPDRATIITQW
ncbi:6-phosphogluconolactonase [Patescibacteria group bacterium]|nr:6-phosphogluconolactonase [Patescibacteria group bacterium]MBU1123479.1 6-phosphogluconolactonase [Patescibacteria group bacterium]MBU1911009.1 6-phosphogluconolactonase [Patescibacteria group bacterium]